MSLKIMNHVWANSKQKGSVLLLLLAMADIADDHGDCFPSAEYLANKARVEVRSIQRAVSKLVEAGELVVFEKRGTKGRNGQMTNLYRIVTTTVEAALALPVPDRSGDANVTTKSSKTTIRKKVVTPVSPPVVTPVSPDPLLDSVKDQEQKEVVVVAPASAPRPFDPFFHAVFLEVTNDPTPAPIPVPEPAPAEPDDADFVIALFSEYFGTPLAPTHQQAQAAVVTYTLPEVRAALEDALAEKRKDATKVIRWSYVNAILERRYQQQLDRVFQSTPHEHALGMRPHYQFASPADNAVHTDPLWQAYRAKWSELTGGRDVVIPPLSVKQYAETARLLHASKVTPEEVTRLVERKWAAGKTNYSFLYVPEHIGEIHAEDALKNRQRDPVLLEAVGKVWKAGAGDFVNGITDLLTAINPAPSPQEVTAFGAWYAAHPQFKSQTKPPTSADLIGKRLAEYRASRKASAPTSSAPTHERPQKYVPTAEELAERLRMSAAVRAARQEGVPS